MLITEISVMESKLAYVCICYFLPIFHFTPEAKMIPSLHYIYWTVLVQTYFENEDLSR